jgi:hypothetical protein
MVKEFQVSDFGFRIGRSLKLGGAGKIVPRKS